VCLVRNHLGIIETKPVNLFGGPDNVPGTNGNTIMTSFAFLFIDDYMAGFTAFRDQQFSIPSNTAMPKKTSKI
jgi:hypothetical protein